MPVKEQKEGAMDTTTAIKSRKNNAKSDNMTPICKNLLVNDNAVIYYTGLEKYDKFLFVLETLLPVAEKLTYYYEDQQVSLAVADQLLMLLIKLRRNMSESKLATLFNVSKDEIRNVLITWINFAYLMWSKIDLWPSRKMVNFYMPDHLRGSNIRVIIDVIDVPIKKTCYPVLKVLAASTPGGMFVCCSDACKKSMSDRDILERSKLVELCEEGDRVIVRPDFDALDLFVRKGVSFKTSTNSIYYSRHRLLKKTFKILNKGIEKFYEPLTSRIFFVCMMLYNFKDCPRL